MKNLILESLQACISFGVKKFDFKYGVLVRKFCTIDIIITNAFKVLLLK